MMQNQHKIEDYLAGKMSREEKAAFEAELSQNKELKSELDFQIELKQFFDTREPKLENELVEFGNQYFKTKPKSGLARYVISVLGVAVIVCIFWLLKDMNSEKIPNDIPESADTLENIIRKETPKDTVINEKPNEEEIPKEELPKPKPDKKPIQKPAQSKPKERPIAQANPADFEKNPILEDLMLNSLRAEEIKTNIQNPESGAILKHEEKTPFKLSGKTTAAPPYQVKIYSNKGSDFDEDIFLLYADLSGIQKEGVYDFSYETRISVPPGLYYLLITQNESGELLKISSFSVK